METPTKPRTGLDIVRELLRIKKEAQRETVYTYRNDPEVRAAYDRLSQKNKERDARNS